MAVVLKVSVLLAVVWIRRPRRRRRMIVWVSSDTTLILPIVLKRLVVAPAQPLIPSNIILPAIISDHVAKHDAQ